MRMPAVPKSTPPANRPTFFHGISLIFIIIITSFEIEKPSVNIWYHIITAVSAPKRKNGYTVLIGL